MSDAYSGTMISDLRNQSQHSYSMYDNNSNESSDSYQEEPQVAQVNNYQNQRYQQSDMNYYNPTKQNNVDTDYNMDPNYMSIVPSTNIQLDTQIIDKKKEYLQELILIVIIYVLLSQPFAIKFFSQIIKLLVPINGRVSTIGLSIYGLILGLIFIFIRRVALPIF